MTGTYDEGQIESIFPQTQPCVICGAPCALLRDGLALHKNCWPQAITDATTAPATTAPEAAAPAAAGEPSTSPDDVVDVVDQDVIVAAHPREAAGLPAAVFTRAGVHFGDRKFLPWTESMSIRNLHDVANAVLRLGLKTVYRTQSAKKGEEAKEYDKYGQAWIADDLAEDLGFATAELRALSKNDTKSVTKLCAEVTRSAPGLTEARKQGLIVKVEDDGLSPFTLVEVPATQTNPGGKAFIVLAAAVQDIYSVPELALEDPKDRESALISPARLAKRLMLFAQASKTPYRVSPMVTATEHMESARGSSSYQRENGWGAEFTSLDRDKCPPAMISRMEDDNHWFRKPMPEEAEHVYVHAYDRSASYLAGMASLELGLGDPTPYPQGRGFIEVPGYWYIDVDAETDDWRRPEIIAPRNPGDTQRWVTTPSLAYAISQGLTPTIHEAYVFHNHAKVLEPWRKQMTQARATLDTDDADHQAARNLIKYEYTRGIGWLQHYRRDKPRPKFYRPDWGHHIVANARVNILRLVDKIGDPVKGTQRWPIGVTIDMIVYTSNEKDPIAAWPGDPNKLGNSPGQFKPEASGLLSHIPEFLNGVGFDSEDAVKKAIRASNGAS